MKKQILNLTAIALVAGAVTLTGCKKEDTTAPVITLKGDATKTIYLGDSYTDEGATAEDDRDGDITASITKTGSVDVNKAGVYTITYDVSDKAGNAATQVKREVTVKVKNASITGNWNTSESCSGAPSSTFVATVSASSSDMVSFTISNFGNYGGSIVVNGTLSGNTNQTVTIPSQTVGGATFSGSGSIEADARRMTISYSASSGGSTVNCTMTMTK